MGQYFDRHIARIAAGAAQIRPRRPKSDWHRPRLIETEMLNPPCRRAADGLRFDA